MISSTLLTLIVIPAIFGLVKGRWLSHGGESASERSQGTQDVPKAA
jgi:Cu(I)/Ag(I) efflux system membrane protein CusA/SilA